MIRARQAALALACGIASGCATSTTCFTFKDPPTTGPAQESVQVSFLGVGGVHVRWQGASVMTAPFYSNPTQLEMISSEIHSDRNRVRSLLPDHVSDTRAVLVGHSHYDHALDVPFAVQMKAKQATVVGNDALTKLLAPIKHDLTAGLVSLEGRDACSAPAYAVAGTRIRIRAVTSEHSPQIGKHLFKDFLKFPAITLWRGEPWLPLATMPARAGEWPSGTTLAFVIDLLEATSDDVAFRIYYQDSPTRKPIGYLPACLAAKPVDLAILCGGGATELPEFPGDIVGAMKPRFVLGTHWEDFFTPRRIPLPAATNVKERIRILPGVSRRAFVRRVTKEQPSGGQVAMPCPESVTYFARNAGQWTIAASDAGWSTPKR